MLPLCSCSCTFPRTPPCAPRHRPNDRAVVDKHLLEALTGAVSLLRQPADKGRLLAALPGHDCARTLCMLVADQYGKCGYAGSEAHVYAC
jgi:hypothetical protein